MTSSLELALDSLLSDPIAALPTAAGAPLGYIGSDVPLDLLFATGRPVAHLPWKADRQTLRAERWLEGSFPGWAHSILEDWSAGRFDGFGEVVFSRGNDASQRLYYYVCELQRIGELKGPRPLIFDAAYVPRETSRLHMVAALRRLGEALAVDDRALRDGIAQANRTRLMLQSVQARREGQGLLHEKLLRASLFGDVLPLLEAQGLPASDAAGEAGKLRVLLAGSAPPDGRLHQAAALAGACVVAEQHEYGLARLGACIDANAADPFDAVVRQRREAPQVGRGFVDPARMLRDAAVAARADAVVLWLTRDDEARAWHVPAQRAALADAGIPALVLPAMRWLADDGAIDRIQEFLRTIRS